MSSPEKLRAARPEPPARDQETTTFTEILRRLVNEVAGARAAVLVDFEGETVDYAGVIDAFELRVAAAHWQIVLSQLSASALGGMRQLTVRNHSRSYVVRRLHAGYAVVIVLHRYAAFAASSRALAEADARLCAEAGWPPSSLSCWFGIEVETDPNDPEHPVRLRAADVWHEIEVIGCLNDPPPRAQGFRVRLECGAEVMILRERTGQWFADEHLEVLCS